MSARPLYIGGLFCIYNCNGNHDGFQYVVNHNGFQYVVKYGLLKQFDMGSILMGMEESLKAGSEAAASIACADIKKWWNNASSGVVTKYTTISYNDEYGTVDIVFHDRIKTFQIWSRTAKDGDISSIIPDGVRFVCGYYNDGSPIEITVEVFGYAKGIAMHNNTPINGWKRMNYNGELIKFVNSNCVFKVL